MLDSRKRQYLFGLIFIGVGIYQFIIKDYAECALYTVAGTAFIVNNMTFEPKLFPYKKALVILSWLLIAASGLLFLYLLQFKYL